MEGSTISQTGILDCVKFRRKDAHRYSFLHLPAADTMRPVTASSRCLESSAIKHWTLNSVLKQTLPSLIAPSS